MDLAFANELSARVNSVIGNPVRMNPPQGGTPDSSGEKTPDSPPGEAPTGRRLKCGVDLGTACIVIVVLDELDKPVACEMEFASVIRDGLVVDYFETLDIVRRLKERIEGGIGQELVNAAIAMPPGTQANERTHRYVVEGAGFEVTNVLDEPTAANAVLKVINGAVVDIGGGTTGYAVIKDGKVVKVGDEPTGGTHLSLVIAGHRGIPLEEAEGYKQDEANHPALLPVVRPVIEKMATIVKNGIADYGAETICLCGGTCNLAGVGEVFEDVCGLPAFMPDHPMLITPLGIAIMNYEL